MVISQNRRKFWIIRPITMNSNGGHFDRFLKKVKESEKYSKNEILWHGVLSCVLVARINDKLEF